MGVAGAQSRLTVTADRTDGNFYQADERNERQLQGGYRFPVRGYRFLRGDV